MSTIRRPFHEAFGIRDCHGRSPCRSFLSFVIMTGTGPVTLATSVCSIFHLLPASRPGYLVRSCFVVCAHGPLGRKVDFVSCSSQAARPRSAPNETGAWWNPTTIRVLRVGQALFFRCLLPSYHSSKLLFTLFLLIRPFIHRYLVSLSLSPSAGHKSWACCSNRVTMHATGEYSVELLNQATDIGEDSPVNRFVMQTGRCARESRKFDT